MSKKKEKELKAEDLLQGIPPELRAMLEQIDIDAEHSHDHDEPHVHGPGCNH